MFFIKNRTLATLVIAPLVSLVAYAQEALKPETKPQPKEAKTGLAAYNPAVIGFGGISQGSNAVYRTSGTAFGVMIQVSQPFGTTDALGSFIGDQNRWVAYTQVGMSSSQASQDDAGAKLSVSVQKIEAHAGGGYLYSLGDKVLSGSDLEVGIGVGMGIVPSGTFEAKGEKGTRNASYKEGLGGLLSADVMPMTQLTMKNFKVMAAYRYSLSFKQASAVSAFSDNAILLGVGYGL